MENRLSKYKLLSGVSVTQNVLRVNQEHVAPSQKNQQIMHMAVTYTTFLSGNCLKLSVVHNN